MCVFCESSSAATPWGAFDEDNRPFLEICFQCTDTVKTRWPFRRIEDAIGIAKANPTFQRQVLYLTKVKLGTEAKTFLGQSVDEVVSSGARWEKPARPFTLEQFREQFQAPAETVPGVVVTEIPDHKGTRQSLVLVQCPTESPKVYLWHEKRLSCTESKFNQEQQIAGNQGK